MKCVKETSKHTWEALVQVRQRTAGSKALIALEEMVVKAGLGTLVNSVQITREGLDLYCSNKNQGEAIVAFITSKMPCRVKTSKKQVSRVTAEYVFVVEVVPVCKYDLIPITTKMGKIQELMLVAKLSSSIHLINPMSCRKMEIKADKYFTNPIKALMTASDMVEFVVLDVQEQKAYNGGVENTDDSSCGKGEISVITHVEVARATDFGINDSTYIVKSHLGNILKAGDCVLGYDLAHSMIQVSLQEQLNFDMQDVVLVRKSPSVKNERTKRSKHKCIESVSTNDESHAQNIKFEEASTIFSDAMTKTTSNLGSEQFDVDEHDSEDDHIYDGDEDDDDDDNNNDNNNA